MNRTTVDLHFKNAVVTGACGGLGQALVRALLSSGAKVAMIGLDLAKMQAVAQSMHAGDRVRYYTPDVSNLEAMRKVADDWLDQSGLPDLIIANAGVAAGFDIEFVDDLQVFKRLLDINVLGPIYTFHPFIAKLRATPSHPCSLVGVASIAGWRGMPGNGAYCASKGALIRYLQSLRAECRHSSMRVHTVSPGYLRTALTAGNTFSMPGLLEPDIAAQIMLKAIQQGKEQIVIPKRIGWLSHLLSLLPVPLHDAILLRQPRKPRAGEAGSTPIPGLTDKSP
ncbi:MAG: SDR family NAD(P)-dependent oxidoreductase [Gammaproteobacteria bacterium]|nr:SDR family NAD(P)-dependent oxidoreductase [Gammaproteobacteria bacterium]